MRDLLFAAPWWLLMLFGLAAAALLFSGNARQDKRLLRIGLVVLLVGALIALLSYLIDTPREKVEKGSRALVKAAVDRDKTTLNTELHPNASLAAWKRQQIIDGAVTLADQFGLKTATITGMEVVQDDPTMFTVKMRVLARFEGKQAYFDTTPTDWQLTWWETAEGKWLIKDITPLGVGNLQGNRISRQYFGGQ
jgi:hypothetical protein